MGFPDVLRREVVCIERIADHEQGGLQVYLIELKHVTVALTQVFTRVFKDRGGLFLLVLTTPTCERLDFVLLQPISPERKQATGGPGKLQTIVLPRTLSVERRNPIQTDIDILDEIWHLIRDITPEKGDKLECLKSLLGNELRDQKVLLFTYYKDTARYLFRELGLEKGES
jgi:hypothetical protein